MPESDPRVAVYIDFDNIVISRYDALFGRGTFMQDRQKDPARFTERAKTATVDLDAVLDFAASFGTLALTRAYADWSLPVNAGYRGQLVERAIDLVQLFPAAAYGKNGGDIRLAVDAMDDLFRLADITHVVIVSGDSDFIPLVQRAKRLGRRVIGIGVASSTARSLTSAVDEFVSYENLPGVTTPPLDEPEAPATTKRVPRRASSAKEPDPQEAATDLLERALRIVHEKNADDDWLHSSEVKTQIKRMDPSFSEKGLGYRSFSEFVKARPELAELDDSKQARMVRMLPSLQR